MENLWRNLLIIKKEVDDNSPRQLKSLQVILKEEKIEIIKNSKPVKTSVPSVFCNTSPETISIDAEVLSFRMISDWFIHFIEPPLFEEKQISFLRIYLPYCFASLIAKKKK